MERGWCRTRCSAVLAQVADKLGLRKGLSLRLGAIKQRRRGHGPGGVIRDLAVMLADGGECVSDLGAVRDQEALFGKVASDSTAFGVIDRIASEKEGAAGNDKGGYGFHP